MMDMDIIKGNWKEVKGKIRQQWGKITEDDMQILKGSYEELEGLLQKAYGYQRERADEEINKFIEENHWH